jgi:hypothetical protein
MKRLLKGNDMTRLVLFCKSYRPDMLRTRRLAQSLALYNLDDIPFYLSVPAADREAFEACFKPFRCHILTDEEILAQTRAVYGPIPSSFPPHLVQQLVKLEFWRMHRGEHYLWLDSDSYFIRAFGEQDFFREDVPLTVMHDGGDLFEFMARLGKHRVLTDFQGTVRKMQELFNRNGPDYAFGPSPVLWSCQVLQALAEEFILPRKTTIYEILRRYPGEITLYGEYLLYSRKIPLYPVGPFFKVFHYPEQFCAAQERGEWDHSLAERYLGVVIQSNWARLPLVKKGLPRRVREFVAGLTGSRAT